jgi:hypothetical protein
MKPQKPHKGKVLAAAVAATRRNKQEVAKKAGYSRSAYYKHVEMEDLDDSILIAYGRVINHDFTLELPQMPKYLVDDPVEKYGKPKTYEEAMQLAEMWKDKYVDLLEIHNKLLRKVNPL